MFRHPFAPVYDENSKILILGTFPSVKSRENEFYYGHPQNRFWKVLAAVFKDEVPASIDEKIQFLHQHHIALWDVIATCEITGSADASITNATPNDIADLLTKAPILKICCNGTKAWELFQKYIQPGLDNVAKLQTELKPRDNTPALRTKLPLEDYAATLQKKLPLEEKYSEQDHVQIPAVKLPSTSPANAAWTLEKLVAAWEEKLPRGE